MIDDKASDTTTILQSHKSKKIYWENLMPLVIYLIQLESKNITYLSIIIIYIIWNSTFLNIITNVIKKCYGALYAKAKQPLNPTSKFL